MKLYYKNSSFWHSNSRLVLKTTKTAVFVFLTEIIWRTFWRNNWRSIIKFFSFFLLGIGIHAPPWLLSSWFKTRKYTCNWSRCCENCWFWSCQRNQILTTLYRLCVNKMVCYLLNYILCLNKTNISSIDLESCEKTSIKWVYTMVNFLTIFFYFLSFFEIKNTRRQKA